MESSVQCDFRREFPIFPLRQTVMFPHSVVPLHIFEPRYRQMLDDALDRVGQLVTATTHPDAEEERPGEPSPLLPVGCIGQIVDHERLPDGRYNILLQGLCRVEIEELNEATDERLYRLGRLSPMVDTEAAQHDRPEARDLIRIALQGPGVGRMSMADDLQSLLDRRKHPWMPLWTSWPTLFSERILSGVNTSHSPLCRNAWLCCFERCVTSTQQLDE